jgi:Amt family ammonium transporter
MYGVKLTRTLRVSKAGELEGLDLHEHGVPAYNFEINFLGFETAAGPAVHDGQVNVTHDGIPGGPLEQPVH